MISAQTAMTNILFPAFNIENAVFFIRLGVNEDTIISFSLAASSAIYFIYFSYISAPTLPNNSAAYIEIVEIVIS
jgi:hypothetical protein